MIKYSLEDVIVFEKPCKLDLVKYEEEDRVKWKELFDAWVYLRKGMKEFESRSPNIPEGLSESAFCMHTGSVRVIGLKGDSSSSFDTFNVDTGVAEQIKACSVEKDLTSFGPNSVWDKLYFLDFYNKGDIDGTFDAYEIPSKLLYSSGVNANQKMTDQQAEKRRPRLSIKTEIIDKGLAVEIAKSVKVWEF